MSETKQSVQRLGVGAIGVAMLLGGAVLGSGSAAYAVDPIHRTSITAFDPDARASLTLHKLVQLDDGGNSERTHGEEIELSGDEVPIAGVEFTLHQILSYDGESLQPDSGDVFVKAPRSDEFDPSKAVLSSHSESAVSNSAGIVRFWDLPAGVYLVSETATPDFVIKRAEPFVVTLPLVDPMHSGRWIYDVHAYPKNSVSNVVQSVNDSSAVAQGDKVTWTVNIRVPTLAPGLVLPSFTIVNELSDHVRYVSSHAAAYDANGDLLESITFDITTSATKPQSTPQAVNTVQPMAMRTASLAPALVAGAAQFLLPAASPEKVKYVTLSASSGTLQQLSDLAQGGEVVFEIETVMDQVSPDGVISNHAVVTIGDSVLSSDASTSWGQLRIQAVTGAGEAKPVPGVEFKLYRSAEDAKNGTNPVTYVDADDVQRDSVLTSSDGTALYDALKAELAGTSYWLVPVRAPHGFEVSSTPRSMVILPGTADAVGENTVTVHLVSLPELLGETGGVASTGVILGGAALTACGLGLVASRRRKRDTEDADDEL